MIHLTVGVVAGLTLGIIFFALSIKPIWNSFGSWQPSPPKSIGDYVFVLLKLIWGLLWRTLSLAIVGLLLGGMVAQIRGKIDWIAQGDVVREEYKLVALRNTQSVGGTLILGTGYIGHEEFYQYFYEYDGGYVRGRLKVSHKDYRIVVYEEDRQDGVLQFFGCKKITETPKPTSFFSERISVQGSCKRFNRYEFHIPRGSIVRNMKLE